MQEINSPARSWSHPDPRPTAFRLKGTDPTYYTAYTSGGSAYKATLSAVGEVSAVTSLGGTEANPIDVSHLLSVASQELAGLPKQSAVSFNVWFDLNTAMHSALIAANSNLQDYVFRFYRPNSFNCTLVAQVGGFNITSGDVKQRLQRDRDADPPWCRCDVARPVMLTRDQILAANDLPREEVEVPEWGGTIMVGAMTGTDRDAFEESILLEDGKANLQNMRARLAACCIVDQEGRRLFSLHDIEALGKKSAKALERVTKVAQRLNRLGDTQLEEIKGN
jgi:hypothetical protein